MKTIKRIAAFVIAISFCLVLTVSPAAHAQGAIAGQQFGAWIASALVSLNLIGQVFYGATLQENVDAFHQLQHFIGVPTTQELIESLPTPYDVYTFSDAAVSEALNTSIIKIRQGVTTIDGKVYDELWVSPEGAQKLKTNAFDFVTKYNLIAHDTSTLMTGYGTVFNVPLYTDGNLIRSQDYTFGKPGSYQIGDISWSITQNPPLERIHWTFPNGTYDGGYNSRYESSGNYMRVEKPNAYFHVNAYSPDGQYYAGPSFQNPEVGDPFQYDFVSGTIPAPESIPESYGLSVKVPHDQLQNFYTVYPQYNVDNSVINIQEDQVDINELTKSIFDYVESMQDIKAEWTNGEEPEPPSPVDPIENIDENVQSINEYQQSMNQQVNHMHQDIESIHQTQQQQKQVQQQMQQTQQQMQQDTSSIDNTLKDVTATPGESDLPSFKFDLVELFPFCIPFDIYRLLSSFDAEPQAPHVRLPIVIQSIGFNYTLDLDFSSWNPVAQAMRTAELIVYGIALAWATGKVIKW